MCSWTFENYIGDYGTGVGAEDILSNNFDPNKSENLPSIAPAGFINVNISLENFKLSMKAQDESTSSSPLGRHYGHYKTVLDHNDICMVHAQMMSLPWLVGFTPHRWELAIDCTLEKDPGVPKIDRLHLIVIVEEDMNATFKIIWNHRLATVAEKTNFLSPLQFGNRKGKTAFGALLLKIVTMDCFRLYRLNGVILSNNAAACYDSMIPDMTSIQLQALGMPKNAIEMSVPLNHSAKHHIKTRTGITKEYYQLTHNCPSFGEGQGVELFNVCKTKKAERVADTYVDDTGNMYVNKEKQKDKTPTIIRDNIQHIAQTWEQLLYGSGGKLCPKKTFWWLIWWIWKGGKATIATKSEVNINVSITFGREDSTTAIRWKNCNVVAKDLGVLVNPVGNYCPEFE
eukprot:6917731-Ditylum_brightwellii.AAC.1